jgi:hypothetical protein
MAEKGLAQQSKGQSTPRDVDSLFVPWEVACKASRPNGPARVRLETAVPCRAVLHPSCNRVSRPISSAEQRKKHVVGGGTPPATGGMRSNAPYNPAVQLGSALPGFNSTGTQKEPRSTGWWWQHSCTGYFV